MLPALIPGPLSLALHYPGPRMTAASRATVAEPVFPLTAAVLGVWALGASLSASQRLGLVIVAGSVTALGLRERSRPSVLPCPRPRSPATPCDLPHDAEERRSTEANRQAQRAVG